MTISKLRGHLYAIAKIAGDVQAATHAPNPARPFPSALAVALRDT